MQVIASGELNGMCIPCILQNDVETEIRRLKLELKQTMDMYSTARKEAFTAKQKVDFSHIDFSQKLNLFTNMVLLQAMELQHWKISEVKRLEEARLVEEATKRMAESEAQKRFDAEMQECNETDEKKEEEYFNALSHIDLRYRKYTIEEIELATENFAENRKIGEGGYGPVYRCYLDHTPVAIKALRPDAAHGRSQFQQEVALNDNHKSRELFIKKQFK